MKTVLVVDDDPDIRELITWKLGQAGYADVERGFAAGVDDYIAKPFSPREMLGRIQAVLARSQARA